VSVVMTLRIAREAHSLTGCQGLGPRSMEIGDSVSLSTK